MLADSEELQAELVGESRLLQEVAHPLLGGDAWLHVGKGDKPEIHTAHNELCALKYSAPTA